MRANRIESNAINYLDFGQKVYAKTEKKKMQKSKTHFHIPFQKSVTGFHIFTHSQSV